MIDNLDNFCTIDPIDSLGELIVIDEDERIMHISQELWSCHDTAERRIFFHNAGGTELGIKNYLPRVRNRI